MSKSNPDVKKRIIDQLGLIPDQRVSGPELADIQYGLKMQDVSKTQFMRALGSLAQTGEVTWRRSSWGSDIVVLLGSYNFDEQE